MEQVNKSIFILFMCLFISVGFGVVYADENIGNEEKDGFKYIGENYFKPVNSEDILIAEEHGIAYVKNQLLISALIGTDKKAIEEIIKKVDADIVGYIELTNDFQIEFREDKNLDELEKIANYIDSFSFVGAVTLNIASMQEAKNTSENSNDNLKDDAKINQNPKMNQNTDISTWAKFEVENAIKDNLIPNYLQNNYKNPITRQDFAQLVITCIENKTAKSIDDIIREKTSKEISIVLADEKFNDSSDKNVIASKVLGIVNGVGNNNFNPNANITREEAATLLYRLAKYLGSDLTYNDYNFKDKNISLWAKDSINFVANLGIMKGISADKFDPKGLYTREQAYITIDRLFQL